jgi:adenosylmethionine-8-amino-7-oxononanoate aminotransferase
MRNPMEPQEILENMFYRQSPPPMIIKTEGVYFQMADGRKILDASGGPMAVNIGYGRHEVAEAASRSIEKVSYVLPVFASEARIELAKRIRKLMPDGLGRIYFCSGGSEANEAAIKLARQYHVISGKELKYKIISRDLSYHGMTIATLSMGDIKMRKRDFTPMLWDSRRIEACYCYRCPFGRVYPGCDLDCALALEKRLLEEGPETVAAFIAEPIVAAAAGGTVPPPEYFPLIRQICDKYDILLILDEVVTGFGRTGKNMGLNHFNIVPDIATFAKGASSAYAPLGGMAVKDEILERFEQQRADFQHLYTFSAHPLACAVGNEVQRIIEEEQLIDRAAQMGQYLRKSLARLEALPMVGDIRGRGLLWGIEFVKDRETKEPFPKEKSAKNSVLRDCFRKGAFFYPGYYEDELGRGDHIMMSPPFIITEEQIDQCVDILEETLEESLEKFYAA